MSEIMTEATPKARGFSYLPCPKCGADEATMFLALDDLTVARCGECDEEIAMSDVRVLIAKWQRVLTWIDLAPEKE